jgi:DNA-binding SARP family transcriptional activator
MTDSVHSNSQTHSTSGARVEFGVLGPLEVRAGNTTLPVRGTHRRRALGVLIAHANEVVSVDWLVEAIWPERRPRTAHSSLHNMIFELRCVLGRRHLQWMPPGYMLKLAPMQLDSWRFEELQRQADTERPNARLQTLKHALAMWRGCPYAEFSYEDFAQPEIRRLEELRLVALEDLLAATLEVGPAAQAVPTLQSLVELHPYRESARGLLMTALHHAGRPIEALLSYQDYQATLAAWQTQPGSAIAQIARAVKYGDCDSVADAPATGS